jgi:hypothetical protein
VDEHLPIPEKMPRLCIIEIKVPKGGIYKDETDSATNTLNEVRRNANRKYKKPKKHWEISKTFLNFVIKGLKGE